MSSVVQYNYANGALALPMHGSKGTVDHLDFNLSSKETSICQCILNLMRVPALSFKIVGK